MTKSTNIFLVLLPEMLCLGLGEKIEICNTHSCKYCLWKNAEFKRHRRIYSEKCLPPTSALQPSSLIWLSILQVSKDSKA